MLQESQSNNTDSRRRGKTLNGSCSTRTSGGSTSAGGGGPGRTAASTGLANNAAGRRARDSQVAWGRCSSRVRCSCNGSRLSTATWITVADAAIAATDLTRAGVVADRDDINRAPVVSWITALAALLGRVTELAIPES